MTSPQPLRGEGDLPKGDVTSGRYSIILFIKMGDKGEGGVKNLRKENVICERPKHFLNSFKKNYTYY